MTDMFPFSPEQERGLVVDTVGNAQSKREEVALEMSKVQAHMILASLTIIDRLRYQSDTCTRCLSQPRTGLVKI